jgi:hypothetical protein
MRAKIARAGLCLATPVQEPYSIAHVYQRLVLGSMLYRFYRAPHAIARAQPSLLNESDDRWRAHR